MTLTLVAKNSLFPTILLLIAVFVQACGVTRASRTEAAERAIKESPEFQEVDLFCKRINLPDGSQLVEKSRLWNKIGLIYRYKSDLPPQKVLEFYRNYFTESGWERIEAETTSQTLTYKNEKFEAQASLEGLESDVTFLVYCGKLKDKIK